MLDLLYVYSPSLLVNIYIDDEYCISRYLYQRYSNNLFGGFLDSAVARVMDNAVLCGVAEVLSSNPTVGQKSIFFFSIYRHS